MNFVLRELLNVKRYTNKGEYIYLKMTVWPKEDQGFFYKLFIDKY